MTVYTLILKDGNIVRINHRENEYPVLSVSVPKDEFFKLFPNAAKSLSDRGCEIVWIYEGIYDDELTDICQKVCDDRHNRKTQDDLTARS